MMTCMEPEVKDKKIVSSGDFADYAKLMRGTEFRCPECGSAVAWFLELWMCMACHKRRTERQAETGRALLKTLQIENVKEHSDDNPI
jgi:uncharacterized protein (DUF983 family)